MYGAQDPPTAQTLSWVLSLRYQRLEHVHEPRHTVLITKSYCAVVSTTADSLAISFLSKRLSDANLDVGTCHFLNSPMDDQCGTSHGTCRGGSGPERKRVLLNVPWLHARRTEADPGPQSSERADLLRRSRVGITQAYVRPETWPLRTSSSVNKEANGVGCWPLSGILILDRHTHVEWPNNLKETSVQSP